MTSCELMWEIAQQFPHLSPQQAAAAVKAVFTALAEALARRERIELWGFGSFGVKHHRARAGHNPKTGVVIAVPAKTVPFFRVAKALRERVEGQGGPVQGDRQEKTDTSRGLHHQN